MTGRLAGGVAMAAMLGLAAATTHADHHEKPEAAAADDTAIRLPPDFRQEMEHLGSWFVPEGETSGFHDVFASRGTIEAYRRTGAFPDGTVLVKELRAARSGDYTTGSGVRSATAEVKMWFVMVRDAGDTRSEHPLWEKGWGWGLFRPDDPQRNVATSFEADCQGCHLPAQETGWVYVEGYPALQ